VATNVVKALKGKGKGKGRKRESSIAGDSRLYIVGGGMAGLSAKITSQLLGQGRPRRLSGQAVKTHRDWMKAGLMITINTQDRPR